MIMEMTAAQNNQSNTCNVGAILTHVSLYFVSMCVCVYSVHTVSTSTFVRRLNRISVCMLSYIALV